MLDKLVHRLFDYVAGHRIISDMDDMYLYQSWKRGVVEFSDSHNYENHTNWVTCEINVMGFEVFYASGHGAFGGIEKFSYWLFGRKI